MMFRTHLAASLIIGMTILPSFSLETFVFVFLLGTFFPDIDTATSFIGRRFKLVGWLFSHRGMFHSAIVMLMLSFMVYVFSAKAGIAFGIGYASHLLLDMLNYKGVRIFYPLPYKVKGFMKTNGLAEQALFIACLVGGFILVLN